MVPLKILLIDSNDNAPVFSKSEYKAFVNEGSVRFTPELYVEATDADKTSKISYSIIAGNEDNLFSIDHTTGRIRITNNKGLSVSNDSDNLISLTVMVRQDNYIIGSESSSIMLLYLF